MKIKILTSANPDLIDGYRFYEMQAEGVGAYFSRFVVLGYRFAGHQCGCAFSAFRKISSVVIEAISVRGLLPVEDEIALVYAVLDCRRDPAWIRKKLS